jgi:hypothetical protein
MIWASGGSKVAKHLPQCLTVEGSSPAIQAGSGSEKLAINIDKILK